VIAAIEQLCDDDTGGKKFWDNTWTYDRGNDSSLRKTAQSDKPSTSTNTARENTNKGCNGMIGRSGSKC